MGRALIQFRAYNIRNGCNVGLESAFRGVSQVNLDLVILRETKLTGGVYTCRSDGYSVISTDATSRHRGGFSVFFLPSPCYAVEAIQQFGPNVAGFQLEMG